MNCCKMMMVAMLSVTAAGAENLFEGALAGTGGWKLPKGVGAETVKGGILFSGSEVGSTWVEYPVAVPDGVAGKPVEIEIDCESRTPRLVWGGEMKIAQLGATGQLLPESVGDPRWTGHMRPPHKLTRYRESGLVHPLAKQLVFKFELRGVDVPFDAYGLPNSDLAEKLPKLLISHLALRPASLLPFPKYDDRFFVAGVGGGEGDMALKLDRKTAFWYQTRGQGAWSEDFEYAEKDVFFPVCGPGTIEAWFCPDWSQDAGEGIFLFQGYQGYLISGGRGRAGQGEVLGLRYWPKTKKLTLRMKDEANREFSGEGERAIESGKWTHVALCWRPGGEATVWVNGEQVLTLALAGFKAPDLADPKASTRNDRFATELYFGSAASASRNEQRAAKPAYARVPFFTGALDAARVSSCLRYSAAFTPARTFATDAETRALFGFDRSFDGISAVGVRRISGTVLAARDRVDHTLTADGRDYAYLPPAVLPGNDPDKVLDVRNYKELPREEDFKAMRETRRREFTLASGKTERFTVSERVFPDFIEIANDGSQPLVYPIVLNRGDVDPRSFGDLAETLGFDKLDDRGRADAIFNFVLGASDYYRNHTVTFPPGSDSGRSVEYEALTMLNGYCGFECGPLNNMTANMFATVGGLPATQTLGYGHSFEQVFYDGKNHIYDLSAQKFFPAMDNESAAYLAECDREPGILNRAGYFAFNFCRAGTRRFWVQTPSYREKVAFTLQPGERFRAWFVNNGVMNDIHLEESTTIPSMTAPCMDECHAARQGRAVAAVDRFFPHYGSGFLVYDGKPGAWPHRVKSCYPIVAGEYEAFLADGTKAALEISTDGGHTYRPLASPATYAVRARMEFLLRAKAPAEQVTRLRTVTQVQFNPRIFPGRVRQGENAFTLRATAGGAARVTVQYRVNAKPVEIVGALESGVIPGCEKATVVLDPAKGLAVPVAGLSAAAKVAKVCGDIEAKVEGGKLVLASRAVKPFVGQVTVADGPAAKTVTVIVCPGAELRVSPKEPKAGRQFVFAGAKLPAGGKYALWTLTRNDASVTRGKSFTLTLNDAKRTVIQAGQAKNIDTEFLKAPYGPATGRSAWRWDYAQENPKAYPFQDIRHFSAEELDGDLAFENVLDTPLEMRAMLIMPYPERDFRRQLVKSLCGLNCMPELVANESFTK